MVCSLNGTLYAICCAEFAASQLWNWPAAHLWPLQILASVCSVLLLLCPGAGRFSRFFMVLATYIESACHSEPIPAMRAVSAIFACIWRWLAGRARTSAQNALRQCEGGSGEQKIITICLPVNLHWIQPCHRWSFRRAQWLHTRPIFSMLRARVRAHFAARCHCTTTVGLLMLSPNGTPHNKIAYVAFSQISDGNCPRALWEGKIGVSTENGRNRARAEGEPRQTPP